MTAKFQYATRVCPHEYRCADCDRQGVKLWREYQTFSPKLLCATCAAKDQEKAIRSIDPNGKISFEGTAHTTDQIGWYVPAVPTEEGTGYWGYTSVPDDGIAWWQNLPLFRDFM